MYWKQIVAVLMCVLPMMDARLDCEYDENGHTNLICSPGFSDNTLRKGHFAAHIGVYSIQLKACRIIHLSFDSFTRQKSLVNLDLSINKISSLPMFVFQGLTNLKYLNLSHNFINDFSPDLLSVGHHLLELDLTGNQLSNINPGAFIKISMLFLSDNMLRGDTITLSAFKWSDVNFLLLANNNMEGAPRGLLESMKELNYLNLEECSLTVIPTFLTTKNMNALVHLTLKGNKITKITDAASFNNLDDLRVLDLSKNLILEIAEDALLQLRNLEKIDLSGNRLKTITDHQFRNKPALTSVDLSHNVITMLPVNAFRGSKLTNLNVSFNKITYLQDNFCLELRNSGAVLKTFHFTKNPWQCACLRELMRELKSMNVDYDTNSYDGQSPVCVTASQFVCKRQEYDNQLFIDMYDSFKSL